jgi:predicted ATPase/class 3 adenylate cyclase
MLGGVRGDLPNGTVTFLFTDVEGSTRLLYELGVADYAAALTRHRIVLRDAFGRHGGVEIDTQGDSFFVAFPTAPGALAAASEATAGLTAGPIRVRIGIHTGTPLLTEEGYVGVDVHRAARIAAAGHGGQVLVSGATAALLQGAGLRSLGAHRLKDLAAAEQLYQLGEREFAPLNSLYRTNLPVPATTFLGRQRELAEVVGLLASEDVRLLTLTGPPGTGKTRLALQAAAEASERFRDGIWWAALAPLQDASLLVSTVAQALGLREQPAREIAVTLATYLTGKRTLLLLDNAEHLLPDVAAEIARLRGADGPTVLVTSRERLQLQGEHVWDVPPLDAEDGIDLFTTRARALDPSFVAGSAVVKVCERLDSLPLALELAAARTRLFTPEQLLERLAERLDLFKGARDSDPRQQTLRATIDWSHGLLSTEEQRLLRRLSVFGGGSSYEAAEAVCGAHPDTLQSLIDKSLVRRRATDFGARYWMLETIRQFAVERLDESGEEEGLRESHAAHFLELFETRDDARRRGRLTLSEYVGLVRGEEDNARRALAWYRATGDAERMARLAVALHPLWVASTAEGRRVLDEVLVLTEKSVAHDLRGRALWAAAMIAAAQGDSASERCLAEEALPLFTQLGDRRSRADALRRLGNIATLDRQFERAQELLGESERTAVELGDQRLLADAASSLAHIPLYQGDYQQAEVRFRQALQRAREADDPGSVKHALANLGLTVLEQGRLADAAALFRASLAVRVELTHSGADIAIEGLAAIAAERGDAATAARLLGATGEWRRHVGYRHQPFESAILDRTATAARTALGDDIYRRLAQEGAALDLDDAVELALASTE